MVVDSNTSLYCVLGDPVSHSLSPLMHNHAFTHVGYNAVYLAFRVADIASAIAGIKALGIKGASITLPHKVAAMGRVDELDEKAIKIGAINTVINREGRLCGYNSDCCGAIRALMEKTTIKDKDVVLIGAGGAARAIGFGILSEGGRVSVINRTAKRGEQLAADLETKFYALSEINRVSCQILINATPVGMTPDAEELPVPVGYLKKDMVVMDIIYNPLKTRLLKEAENAGCVTIDGLSMFVYQGAFQFELWTGEKAPVEVMRKTVLHALKKQATTSFP